MPKVCKWRIAHTWHDIMSQTEHRQRCPSPEYGVGMHRPETAKAQPAQLVGIRCNELDAQVLTDRRPKQQPKCRSTDVPQDQPSQLVVDMGTPGSPLLRRGNGQVRLAVCGSDQSAPVPHISVSGELVMCQLIV